MRILSQDGNYDFPYENHTFVKDDNEIFIMLYEGAQLIAKYSTEAKAKKAMEMLREEFTGIPHSRRIDDLCGRFKYQGRTDIQLFLEHILIKKDYFQFTADEELEV